MSTSPLQSWINEHTVGNEMQWKGSFGAQLGFVRDTLSRLVGTGLKWEEIERVVDVISTHQSKSIILPVYSMERPDLGLRMIARDNFYNWKLSVISEKPITADFTGLFETGGEAIPECYFEGFPGEFVFGTYEQNPRRWSAEIHGDHRLWTTVFLIMRSLGVIKARGT